MKEYNCNGLYIVYSRVNQAYFLMWHDTLLRIFNLKSDAIVEYNRIINK